MFVIGGFLRLEFAILFPVEAGSYTLGFSPTWFPSAAHFHPPQVIYITLRQNLWRNNCTTIIASSFAICDTILDMPALFAHS